jgi:glycosyltransferase involved in cell wall biosynthesis
MLVTHINATDLGGGASRGVYRLHRGLLQAGVESRLWVHYKSSDDDSVQVKLRERTLIERAAYKVHKAQTDRAFAAYPRSDGWFSPQALPSLFDVRQTPRDGVTHLQWVCGEYLNIEDIARVSQRARACVMTLHDMWALTGGCHYDENCRRWAQQCGACPQLGVLRERDLSREVFERKQRAWHELNLTLIAPCEWLADCVRHSPLLSARRVEVIPYGLDTTQFAPQTQSVARAQLQLPADKKLILFGALNSTADKRKGFHLLQAALQNLARSGLTHEAELIIFGADAPDAPIDLGLHAHYLGVIRDDARLSQIYSAADVMVVPSLQESFGQTASEAMSCGTPVVAFGATGLRDIVDHQRNGYLSRAYDADDLARGIAWILHHTDAQTLRHDARDKVTREFDIRVVTQKHIALYESLLNP